MNWKKIRLALMTILTVINGGVVALGLYRLVKISLSGAVPREPAVDIMLATIFISLGSLVLFGSALWALLLSLWEAQK